MILYDYMKRFFLLIFLENVLNFQTHCFTDYLRMHLEEKPKTITLKLLPKQNFILFFFFKKSFFNLFCNSALHVEQNLL